MKRFLFTMILFFAIMQSFSQGDPGTPCAPYEIEEPPGSGNCITQEVDVPIDNGYIILIIVVLLGFSYKKKYTYTA